MEDATTEGVKARKLWTRLNNGEKNLVILDDVWDELDLKAIGIPITDGTKGCKLVLTSRSQDICQRMLVDKDFQIQVLSEDEAWKLFEKNVGDLDDELCPVAKDVCKECKGLPIAILAIAGALRNKTKHHWDFILQQLRISALKNIPLMDEKVYRILKLSYDHLVPEDAKTCFLICSLFPEDYEIPIEDVVRLGRWMGVLSNSARVFEELRNGVHTLVDILKASSLLLEGEDRRSVKMHDVVRDVAISIAKDEKGFLVQHDIQEYWKEEESILFQQYSTISLRYTTIHKLPNEFSCPELQTLILESSNIPDEFYQNMKNVNALVAREMQFSPLPSSFPYLVNLKMLCLEDCQLTGMAIIKELKNLEILSFRGSNIKELPSELRQLTRLCLLDLSNCRGLATIPPNIISNLSQLEEFYFSPSFRKWETDEGGSGDNASVTELNSLSRLRALAISIPNASSLPNVQIFKNLKIFHILIGGEIDTGMEWGLVKEFTKALTYNGIALKDEVNILLDKAEYVQLIGVLQVDDPCLIRNGRFSNLTHLGVDKCHSLRCLFPSSRVARLLMHLRVLSVIDCEMMEEIVQNEREEDNEEVLIFHGLREITLYSLPNMRSFYTVKKKPTALGTSSIPVDTLFNQKVSFLALVELRIDGLKKIKGICEVARQLIHLKELRVIRCKMMEAIVQNEREEDDEEVIIFHELREIMLENLPKMRTFYSTKKKPSALGTSSTHVDTLFNQKVSFPALVELRIDGLNKIKGIYEVARQLIHLKELYVTDCGMMEAIVQNEREEDDKEVIIFHELREIMLVRLPNCRTFCSTKKKPTVLGTSSTSVDTLFNQKVSFPALMGLWIEGLNKIQGIWEEEILPPEKSFCQLKGLWVIGIENLVNAVIPFNVLPRLQNLSGLIIKNCPKIEGIISFSEKVKEKIVIEFPTLERLWLEELPNLKKIYNSPSKGQFLFNHQFTFPILESLEIDCLDDIEEIWSDNLPTNSFNKLRSLEITRCNKLSSVAPSKLLPSLQSLRSVRIEHCGSLKVIFRSEGWKEGEQETQTIQSDELATTTKGEEFILPPSLRNVKLTSLPCLQHFYSGNSHIEFPPSIHFRKTECPEFDESHLSFHKQRLEFAGSPGGSSSEDPEEHLSSDSELS